MLHSIPHALPLACVQRVLARAAAHAPLLRLLPRALHSSPCRHTHDASATPASGTIRVHAAYVATRMDLPRLSRRIAESCSAPPAVVTSHSDRDWLILRMGYAAFSGPGAPPSPLDHTFVSLSRRGAVIVVNAPNACPCSTCPLDLNAVLGDRSIVPSPLVGGALTEDLNLTLVGAGCVERRVSSSTGGELRLPVKDLNLDGVRILNSVLAQTVNLQHFELKLDRMYELVQDIFKGLESAGESSDASGWMASLRLASNAGMSTRELYRHLGATSSISNAVMLSGLRTSVRPGSTAWNEEAYAQMHEALWSEFDLEERYDELERRLGYITESIKFALEVAKDDKTIMLERLIVLLIAAELGISIASTGAVSSLLALLPSLT